MIIYRMAFFAVLGVSVLGSLFLPPIVAASALVPTPTATTVVVTVPMLWSDAIFFVVVAWGVFLLYGIYRIILGLIT